MEKKLINKNTSRIKRLELDGISKRLGLYNQATIISPGASLYSFSGQVGADLKGQLPSDFNRQVDNCFANIARLLVSQDLGPENIIKFNIWATEEIDWDYFDSKYDEFFSKSYPSMTVAYVQALGTSEIKLEIEVWAGK